MKVQTPADPRLSPLVALRRLMPVTESQAERHELRKIELREQVRK